MLRAVVELSEVVWNSISSAKREVKQDELGFGKSYIKMIQRVGLNTAPCGTPRLSLAGEENWLLIRTEKERSERNFFNQFRIGPEMFNLLNLYSKAGIHTES
jgi:hypothetical protein